MHELSIPGHFSAALNRPGNQATIHTAVATLLLPMCFIQNGWNPLMAASCEGHVDIVRLLLKAKAQVNTQEKV